jgi:hypothetical protein
MNQPSTGTTVTTTFVVRFWREWTGAESRWRGRIEHVQSGQQADFLYLDDMLRFLRQMGVTFGQLTDSVEHDTSAPP